MKCISPLTMDNMQYHYYPNTNRLEYVYDSVNATNYATDIDQQKTGNYAYDASGNLVMDRQEDIDIQWDYLGKVKKIDRIGSTTHPVLSFYYDAMGQRVIKELEGDSAYWYVYGADNSLMAIYSIKVSRLLKKPNVLPNTSSISIDTIKLYAVDTHYDLPDGFIDYGIPIRLLEHPIYGSERLGSYEPNRVIILNPKDSLTTTDTTHIQFIRGDKRYTLENQVGNVQMVLSDKNSGNDVDNDSIVDYYDAVVLSSTDYFPFGSVMPGRSFSANLYRYGFQGQEKDDEIKGNGNSVNFKFRMYDPRLGRFFSVDPLASRYVWNSPYAFSENSVINAVELEGLEKSIIINNSIDGYKQKIKVVTGDEMKATGAFYSFSALMKDIGLLNDNIDIHFKHTGVTEAFNGKDVTISANYEAIWQFSGETVRMDMTVPVSSIHITGTSPIDYPLALIGSGIYSQVFKKSLRPLYNQAASTVKSTALSLLNGGKFTSSAAARWANTARNSLKTLFAVGSPQKSPNR